MSTTEQKKTLFDLTGTILELDALLESQDPDTEACKEGIAQYLKSIEDGELSDKLEGYCRLVKSYEAEARALQEEAQRYSAAATVRLNKSNRLKERLYDFMTTTGRTEAKAGLMRVVIQKNGGNQPMQCETDPGKVPEEFVLVHKSVDKKAVYDKLLAGETFDFAQLLPRGQHLQIKL